MSGKAAKSPGTGRQAASHQSGARVASRAQASTMNGDSILGLQRSAGNQAVNKVLGNELKGGQALDFANSGAGQPLEPQVRRTMEEKFGEDFGRVRIHVGTEAGQAALSLKAKAYTLGSNVVFGSGRYAPQTEHGANLLQHELAHVLQQKDVQSNTDIAPQLGPPGPLEAEASQAAETAEVPVRVKHRINKPAIQRASDDDNPQPKSKKRDVSEQFQVKSYRRGKKTYKQASGELGVPGAVKVHRSRSAQRAVSAGTGEDAGHLIGNRFGAPGGPENLSRQNWISNRHGTYKSLENAWEAKLKSGARIEVSVTDITRDGENHPFMRRVEWTEEINGVKTNHEEVFANPHTPESRSQQNIAPTTHEGEGGRVLKLDDYRKQATKQAEPQNVPDKPTGSAQAKAPTETELGKNVKPETFLKAEEKPPPAKASPIAEPAAPIHERRGSELEGPKPERSTFETVGEAIHPEYAHSTISGPERSGGALLGEGLAVLVPAAQDALQDKIVQDEVAGRMLGDWDILERWRKEFPKDWILGVVSLKEWGNPDPEGRVGRGVNYVAYFHGKDKQTATAQWRASSTSYKLPGGRWKEVGPFFGWIGPEESLDKIAEELEGKRCFIATACYQSTFAPQVELLREFRDAVLRDSFCGRLLVRTYYKLSPPIARFLVKHELPCRVVRELFLEVIVTMLARTHRHWKKIEDSRG